MASERWAQFLVVVAVCCSRGRLKVLGTYLLRFEERDPYIIQELQAILPGEVTQVGDERRSNEDVATQSFLLLLILHDGLRPAQLL